MKLVKTISDPIKGQVNFVSYNRNSFIHLTDYVTLLFD